MKFRLVILVVGLACSAPSLARAGQLGGDVPSNCVAHSSFSGGADLEGDYRCAGLAIDFHTAGVGRSPFPIWAGQWLFADESGQFRVGSCTLNRGVHPTITEPSSVVGQSFPNDPGGALGAYLTWRYGDTTDNLTAAAMWVVFHYYAQDAAGTTRSPSGSAPLVPSLDMVGRASGRADLQQRVNEIEGEARRFAAPWELTADVSEVGSVGVSVRVLLRVSLRSGSVPIEGATVTVFVGGVDDPLALITGADGSASASIAAVAGRLTIAATAAGPGGALVYRGTPAAPDPQGAQTLVTGGEPVLLRAIAAVDIPEPPTTTAPPTTTTTEPTTTTTTESTTTTTTTMTSTTSTTEPATTTTEPGTTTTEPPPTTTTGPTEPPTSTGGSTTTPELTVTSQASTVSVLVPSSLPTTGSSPDGIAYGATAALVAGIGLIGTVRRRVACGLPRWRRFSPRG